MNLLEKLDSVNVELKKGFTKRPISVSKCLGFIKTPFDQEAKAKSSSEKGFNDPSSPYYQKTPEDVIKMWTDKADTSKHYGSLLDDYIGIKLTGTDKDLKRYALNNNLKRDERLQGLCKGFDQFWELIQKNTDYQFVAREQPMYIKSTESGKYINGRFDCIMYSPSLDRWMVIDWKNTEKIPSTAWNGKDRLLGPCNTLQDCKHNEYTLQTHFYKKALCETYGMATFDNVDCYVVQMKPQADENGKHFQMYKQNFEFDPTLLDDIIDFAYETLELE